jgi:Ca2+-binding EF-hand superfamily protein
VPICAKASTVRHGSRADAVRGALAFISELDADMSVEEAASASETIDTDRNGVINFDEFVEWWTTP